MYSFRFYALILSALCIATTVSAHTVRDAAEQLFTDMREQIQLLPSMYAQTKRTTQVELASIEKKALRIFALLDEAETSPITRQAVEPFLLFYSQLSAHLFFELKRHQAVECQRLLDKLSEYINKAHKHGLCDDYARTMLDVNARMRAFFNPQLYPKAAWHINTGAQLIDSCKKKPALSMATVALGITSIALLIALCKKKGQAA